MGTAMTDPMTPERVAQIRGREAAATPGPWTWSPGRIDALDNDNEHFSSEIIMWVSNIPGGYDDDDAAAALGACGTRAEEDAVANLAFLAAARQDVPVLLAEVDRCHGILARFGVFEQEWAAKTGSLGTVIWPWTTSEKAARIHVEDVQARGSVAQVMCRLVGEPFPADNMENADV